MVFSGRVSLERALGSGLPDAEAKNFGVGKR